MAEATPRTSTWRISPSSGPGGRGRRCRARTARAAPATRRGPGRALLAVGPGATPAPRRRSARSASPSPTCTVSGTPATGWTWSSSTTTNCWPTSTARCDGWRTTWGSRCPRTGGPRWSRRRRWTPCGPGRPTSSPPRTGGSGRTPTASSTRAPAASGGTCSTTTGSGATPSGSGRWRPPTWSSGSTTRTRSGCLRPEPSPTRRSTKRSPSAPGPSWPDPLLSHFSRGRLHEYRYLPQFFEIDIKDRRKYSRLLVAEHEDRIGAFAMWCPPGSLPRPAVSKPCRCCGRLACSSGRSTAGRPPVCSWRSRRPTPRNRTGTWRCWARTPRRREGDWPAASYPRSCRSAMPRASPPTSRPRRRRTSPGLRATASSRPAPSN